MTEPNKIPRTNLWRQDNGRPGGSHPDEPSRNRRQLFFVLTLFLALLGAIAAWLSYPSPVPMPTFLGVWIDEYRDDGPIPANPWAAHDRDALKKLAWENIGAFPSQERRLLVQVLNELRDRTERPVVVLISAHAIAHPDGNVYLLPADARLEDPGTWVSLKSVLRSLHSCRARHRFLILDLMHPYTAPRRGLLADDVPVRVQPILEAAHREDPKLQMLWACASGQHSLPAEELGHSAFAYYLLEGLKGQADGYRANGRLDKRDGRVTVQELVHFVQARVYRWSHDARKTLQAPQFRGKDDDFTLIAAPEGSSTPPALAAALPYPKWLRAAWQKRDEWQKEPWPRVPPNALRKLEDTLLRAEEQLHAGLDSGRVERLVVPVLKELEAERLRVRTAALPRRPTPSLAREVARGRKRPDLNTGNVLEKYRDLLALATKLAAIPKADPKDQERLKTNQAALLKEFKDKPFDLAWMVFDELLKRELRPTQERVRFVAQLLGEEPQAPPYEEIDLVRRLAAWKVETKNWDGQQVRVLLQLTDKATQALAAADDKQLRPWVKDYLAEAKKQRQVAERALFDPGEMTAEEVSAALNDALRINQELLVQLRTLAEAFRVRDDALVRLAGYAPYLEDRPGEETLWLKAIKSTHNLQDELKAPPSHVTAETFLKIGNLTATLQDEGKDRLQGPLVEQARALIRTSDKAGVDELDKMNALLRIPWLEAGERANLWVTEQAVARRLTQAVLDKDASDWTAGRQTRLLRAVPVAGAAAAEQKQALRRVRVSLGLLQLRGVTDLKAVEKALARVQREPTVARAWSDLGECVRQAWAAQKAAARVGESARTP